MLIYLAISLSLYSLRLFLLAFTPMPLMGVYFHRDSLPPVVDLLIDSQSIMINTRPPPQTYNYSRVNVVFIRCALMFIIAPHRTSVRDRTAPVCVFTPHRTSVRDHTVPHRCVRDHTTPQKCA